MKTYKEFRLFLESKPNYIGVILDDDSREKLLNHPEISQKINGLEPIAHHMTIKVGSYEGTNHLEGTPVKLTATHIGYLGDENNPSVVAVKVSGYPSKNKDPHITVGVNRELGGKPFHSNNIRNWDELNEPINLNGEVRAVYV